MLILCYKMELIDCKTGTLARIISVLRENKSMNKSRIAHASNITYSHCVNILELMEKEKLVKFVKKGRGVLVEYTPKLLKLRVFEIVK